MGSDPSTRALTPSLSRLNAGLPHLGGHRRCGVSVHLLLHPTDHHLPRLPVRFQPRAFPHTRAHRYSHRSRAESPRASEASAPRAPSVHARIHSAPDATAYGAPRPGARHPASRARPMSFPSQARLTSSRPDPPKPAASGRTAAPRASTRARRASRRASSGESTPSGSSCATSDLRFSPTSTIPCPSKGSARRCCVGWLRNERTDGQRRLGRRRATFDFM